jgi:hypothetical protein
VNTQIALLLVGASATLVVTCLVQIFVVPRVQAHTRRRERWERSVDELVTVLDEELPRALNGYRSASVGIRIAPRWWRDDAETDQQKREALLAEWSREHREADRVVGENMARLGFLVRRISRLRPSAPYWGRLQARMLSLRVALWEVEPWGDATTPDDDTWEAAWEKITAQREKLFEVVKQIADPPKPPPRMLLRRFRSGLASMPQRTTLRAAGRSDRREPQLRDQAGA